MESTRVCCSRSLQPSNMTHMKVATRGSSLTWKRLMKVLLPPDSFPGKSPSCDVTAANQSHPSFLLSSEGLTITEEVSFRVKTASFSGHYVKIVLLSTHIFLNSSDNLRRFFFFLQGFVKCFWQWQGSDRHSDWSPVKRPVLLSVPHCPHAGVHHQVVKPEQRLQRTDSLLKHKVI